MNLNIIKIIIFGLLMFGCVSLGIAQQESATLLNSQDLELFQEIKTKHALGDAQAYQVLGMAYLKQGFSEKASFCFEKAVQLDQKLYLSWYHLGLIHMDNPEPYFTKAIETNPDFALSYYWLAMYLKQCDRNAEAASYFRKYLETVDRGNLQEHGRIEVAEKELEF